MEHKAGPLLVDAQSTKRKRAESLDERPTEAQEKKRKLRSTVVSEPEQIKANGPKFSSLETELHDTALNANAKTLFTVSEWISCNLSIVVELQSSSHSL